MGVIKVPLPYDYLKDGVRYCVYMVYSTVPGKYQVLKNQCFSTFVVQITCFWISWAASYKFRCLPLLRSSSSEALGVAPGTCVYSKGSGIFVSTIVWKHQRVSYHMHSHKCTEHSFSTRDFRRPVPLDAASASRGDAFKVQILESRIHWIVISRDWHYTSLFFATLSGDSDAQLALGFPGPHNSFWHWIIASFL